MAWVEKNTSQMPSVVVGRSATVIPRKALPTLKIRPKDRDPAFVAYTPYKVAWRVL